MLCKYIFRRDKIKRREELPVIAVWKVDLNLLMDIFSFAHLGDGKTLGLLTNVRDHSHYHYHL